MSYQGDLSSALLAAPAIAALVGDRVFADVADGTTEAPYLVFQTISTQGETSHDGRRDLEFPLIQISAWANTKAEAIGLSVAVCAAIEGRTLDGESDLTLSFDNQNGQYDPASNLYGEQIDFRGACNRNQ